LFSISLVPTIVNTLKFKEIKSFSWITLLITSIGLFIMSWTFLTLNCYLTFVTNLITSICWFILLYLKIRYEILNVGDKII